MPTLLEGAMRIEVGTGFVQLTYTKIFILVAAFVGMGLLTYVIKYTKLGRMCRATQQDRKMASITGINTDRVISYVFVIGAVMAATAGVLITMNYGTFDFYAGFIIGIKAFTAAVLGGIGSCTAPCSAGSSGHFRVAVLWPDQLRLQGRVQLLAVGDDPYLPPTRPAGSPARG